MILVIVATLCDLVVGQKGTHGNPDAVLFPGTISSSSCSSGCDQLQLFSSESLAAARDINEIDSVPEFLNVLNGVPPEEQNLLISTGRFGGEERTSARMPVPAKCMPELQPVEFRTNEKDLAINYFPSCTRIKRCGGCCAHSLLSCQPVTMEIQNFKVVAWRVKVGGQRSYKSMEIIALEEHTSCACKCKIKEEYCTSKQRYLEPECRCACLNEDEEAKCRAGNETKLWDPEACACLCRTLQECNTGYYFDQNTCSCRQISTSKRFNGPNYGFPQPEIPPEIIPLSASDPRRKHKDEPNN